jgi:mxaK protein
LWTLLLTGLLAAGWQLSALYAVRRDNMAILQLLSGRDILTSGFANAAPEVRLARAHYFKEQRRYDEALATLNLIVPRGDAALQAKIRYNLGNVYLQQALEQREAMQINAARLWPAWRNRRTGKRWRWTAAFGTPNTISTWRCA